MQWDKARHKLDVGRAARKQQPNSEASHCADGSDVSVAPLLLLLPAGFSEDNYGDAHYRPGGVDHVHFKFVTLRARESKVRLRAAKTTVASPARRFKKPCESFKGMTARHSDKSASMSKMPFISDLLLSVNYSFGRLVCFTALLPFPIRTMFFLADFHLLLRLGTSRRDEQHGLESTAELAHLRGLETGVQDCLQGIAVPMVIAHAARRHRDQRILHPRSYSSVRAHMFEEQEGPSRFEHAPDLAQAALWILHGTEDERDHHCIEMCVGEWEALDWGACERDGDGSTHQAPPGLE